MSVKKLVSPRYQTVRWTWGRENRRENAFDAAVASAGGEAGDFVDVRDRSPAQSMLYIELEVQIVLAQYARQRELRDVTLD
jgi:hypothetical protein